MAKKLRVGVIFGGHSGEHEISILSARGVVGALNPQKFEIVPIAIDKSGRWLTVDLKKTLRRGKIDVGQPTALLADPTQRGLVNLSGVGAKPSIKLKDIDVVFPVVHGPYGEDGTLQGLLELANVPYVGAGVLGSAVGMDKVIMKDLFRAHNLPVLPAISFLRSAWPRSKAKILKQIKDLGLPCFVKPANMGSSVGISKVLSLRMLGRAVLKAFQYDRKIIVEKGCPHPREIEIAVLGNDNPMISVPGEIIPNREFYDYHTKYMDNQSKLIIPAKISPAKTRQLKILARRAYKILDLCGMARVDFLIDAKEDRVYLSEVNTIPGFTPISMYPKLWEASGLSYARLLERLILLALERHADKGKIITNYPPSQKTKCRKAVDKCSSSASADFAPPKEGGDTAGVSPSELHIKSPGGKNGRPRTR